MFLRRLLASLARAYMLHVHMIFFLCRYIWGLAPPPPPYQKAGYATVASFRSPNEDGRFRPPHSLHEIAATGNDISSQTIFLTRTRLK